MTAGSTEAAKYLQPSSHTPGAHAAEVAGLAVSVYDDQPLAMLILRGQVLAVGPADLRAQAVLLLETAARLDEMAGEGAGIEPATNA